MAKIGIMGGTFDPIHNGHIEMAQKAKERLGLLKVLFVTGGNPPHKKEQSVSPGNIRHVMVTEAIKDYSGFEACDYEITKNGYSYTAETLQSLSSQNPGDEFFFILGADSLDYIDKWHKPEVIFSLAKIVVFARGEFDCLKKTDILIEKFKAEVIILNDEIPDISSTNIRMYADMDMDISQWIPQEVEKIIKRERLYKGYFSKLRADVEKAEKPSRFIHVLGVCKFAVKMAEIFGEDIKKTYTAALLHDIAKNTDEKKMYEMCAENGVFLDEFELENPQLVHAKLGAYLAKAEYGVKDEDIINAVKWHTLGRCNMTKLEKIIFVADMVEEGRKFPGVENLRRAAFENLDKAVYLCADATIRFNEERKRPVHKNAYMLREHFGNICGM